MSDPTAQEPTMEEILASIRRIISEDDAPAAEPAAAAHAEPEPEAPPPPPAVHLVSPSSVYEEDEDDEVLELTEPAPKPAETHGDIDVFAPEPKSAPEPVKAAEPAPKPEPVKAAPVYDEPEDKPFGGAGFDDDRLISGGTEDKAASHFGKLSQSIAMPAAGPQPRGCGQPNC